VRQLQDQIVSSLAEWKMSNINWKRRTQRHMRRMQARAEHQEDLEIKTGETRARKLENYMGEHFPAHEESKYLGQNGSFYSKIELSDLG
jgi:hypothetical protein